MGYGEVGDCVEGWLGLLRCGEGRVDFLDGLEVAGTDGSVDEVGGEVDFGFAGHGWKNLWACW